MSDLLATVEPPLSLADLRQHLRSQSIHSQAASAVIKTGFTLLDQCLPQQGWSAGVVELLLTQPLSGELSLLLPALQGLQVDGRRVALVNPPAIPYAPGLHSLGLDLSRLVVLAKLPTDDATWACEQLLQSQACGAIVAWLDPRKPQSVRRLQLQAKAQRSVLFLCRPVSALRQSSVAQARIQLTAQAQAMQLVFHKLQGEIRRPELTLPWTTPDLEMVLSDGA